MITYYFRTLKDDSLKQIDKPRSGVWINVSEPTDNELSELVEKFSLDEDILADAKDLYEIPRMEKTDNATYFFTRYPYRAENQNQVDVTAPILIVVGSTFVMTIHIREVPQFSRIISGHETVHTTQKTKFFIHLMSIFTNSFDRELKRLQKAVHKDRVRLSRIGPKDIERLVGYESSLNNMVDALVPTNTWLQKVTGNNSYMHFFEEDLEIMQDLVIANSQVVNSARSVLTTIQNIRGSIEAIMTSRLNNALKILTVLTILLTIPLVITSMYGMNVALPMQDNPSMFFIILGFSTIMLISLVILFRRNEWL
ncbi:MAG: magnesium transporter CorA family protein [Candidatus Nomurabacteria bacterium]|nr:magnesium transporter CorA family protein [Candidatus Nomurabacteria bacterium]USN87420.1 MAG: magnesium transporter CorA family protein [Candidatus Nomurabacteria bacterium]